MTTAQTVFDMAMSLMDNQNTGSYEAPRGEYTPRALDILNLLHIELYPYADSFGGDGSTRPTPAPLSSFEDEIGLDDAISRGLLPYGLAAHLLLMEDPGTASFFQQRYQELKAQLARGYPRQWQDIGDAYGGFPYNDYGSW